MKNISATPNHSARTFTIRTHVAKYRTSKMSKEEFNDCLFNTKHDWMSFLADGEYVIVKYN